MRTPISAPSRSMTPRSSWTCERPVSPEVSALVSELDELRWTGRKGYGARTLVAACLVKSLYAIPTWTRVVALIREHAALREACGGAPSVFACYRFATKLRQHKSLLEACLDRLAASLREQLPEMGRDVAIDGSDLPATRTGSGSSRRMAPSVSASPTRMPRGATARPSRLGRAAGSMASSCTPPSARGRVCRSRGKSNPLGSTRPTLLSRFSMRSCRAALPLRPSPQTRATTSSESMRHARTEILAPSSLSGRLAACVLSASVSFAASMVSGFSQARTLAEGPQSTAAQRASASQSRNG